MDNRFKELARLWTRHMNVVETYFVSLWVRDDEIEDLLQETVTQLFRKAATYDFQRPFVPWVLGIARYVVLRHRRDLARHRHVFSPEAFENLSSAFEEVSDLQESLRKNLDHCIAQLPAGARQLCRLRYEENLRLDAIARQQSSSITAVKVALHRLRAQLRECIARKLRREVH